MKVGMGTDVKVDWDGGSPRRRKRHLPLRTADPTDTSIGLSSSETQEGTSPVAVAGLVCGTLLGGHGTRTWDS